jgi:hypothetical protein
MTRPLTGPPLKGEGPERRDGWIGNALTVNYSANPAITVAWAPTIATVLPRL